MQHEASQHEICGERDFTRIIDSGTYERTKLAERKLTAVLTEFQPEYLGKFQFYLEALDRNVKKEHENPSIGTLICSSKDDEVVQYVLSRNVSPTMIAKYETHIVDKKLLQQKALKLTFSSTNWGYNQQPAIAPTQLGLKI